MAIGSGISFSVSGVLQALSNISTTVVGTLENTAASLVGPWRPPQWAGPAQTTITVPGNSAGIGSTADLGVLNGGAGTLSTDANTALGGIPTFSATTGRTATPDIIYVFDGVLQLEHTQEVVVTEHPVENSENITDHAFIKAARVSLDVLMSDAMQSYILGQWTGSSSKSVSAYQTILGLQLARKPLILTTRLNTYTNMLITSIHTPDNYKTAHGLSNNHISANLQRDNINRSGKCQATNDRLNWRWNCTNHTVAGRRWQQLLCRAITCGHSDYDRRGRFFFKSIFRELTQ